MTRQETLIPYLTPVSRPILVAVALFFFILFTSTCFAATNLNEAVRQAVTSNPEVLAKYNAFLAARQQTNGARGGWLPRVDLSGRIGWETYDTDTGRSDYTPREAALELTQLLFDGGATRYRIEQFSHLERAAWYDLMDTAENIALEAVRAYLDVLRYRRLLDLAEENYQQHHKVYLQVKERVEAGIGRGVDLEQATGRLALAESNRITEAANLHDVSARYLRIVGEVPAEKLQDADIVDHAFPKDKLSALKRAFSRNPEFIAAMEQVWAAQAEQKRTRGLFRPRFDLHARTETGYDRSAIEGQSSVALVELRMNYNLFNGGSDLASQKERIHRIDEAREKKNKVCRNIRQTLDIAYTDVIRLEDQIEQLKLHMESIARAREAYRKQFDIGQRTLLDLLDTENEYFQARRSYVSALVDREIAYARTQAAMGALIDSLGARPESLPQLPQAFVLNEQDLDPDAICPLTVANLVPLKAAPIPESKPLPKPVEPEPKVEKFDSLVVHFPVAKTTLSTEDLEKIDHVAEILKQFPNLKISLAGHTDSTGPDAFNYRLSRSRAEVVRNRLVYKHGIDPSRVLITWFSYKRPIADNSLFEGRRKNRRTEGELIITLTPARELKKVPK
ncbi:MAG: hypothetical protein D6794_07300 [Deltaproteobacteria bacterium]|nr:MAG: hypothetical protein D6794_07300 [Deltaproteobacteria bacterium]